MILRLKLSEKMKNLPQKPAVNGIPAKDNKEIVKQKANPGLFFANPSNDA